MFSRSTTTSLVATAAVVLASLAACGDDDAIALDDWVAEFDRHCVEVVEQAADRELSDAEFQQLTRDALAEMRELGEPDDHADAAATLLESIETTTLDDTLTDAEIADLDQQFLDAAETVGVSDTCIAGPEG